MFGWVETFPGFLENSVCTLQLLNSNNFFRKYYRPGNKTWECVKHWPMVETLIDGLGMLSWSPCRERSLSSYLQSFRELYTMRKWQNKDERKGRKGCIYQKWQVDWFMKTSLRIFTLHNPWRKIWLSTGLMSSFRLTHSPPSRRDCMIKLSMGGDWDWGADHHRRIPSELLLTERFVGGSSLATTGSASVEKYYI